VIQMAEKPIIAESNARHRAMRPLVVNIPSTSAATKLQPTGRMMSAL